MDIGLPGHEPVGRERQLALARGAARHLLVEPQQPLVGQFGLRLQHLQACAQLDQLHGALDLAGLGQDALYTHGDQSRLKLAQGRPIPPKGRSNGGLLSGHQDGGMQTVDAVSCRGFAVAGDQAPDQVVCHPQAAQQRVAGRDLQDLRRAQARDQGGRVLADAQAVERLLAVGADQALGEHQVGEIGFPNLGKDLLGGHGGLQCGCVS
mmetsp:Transcript_100365/g.279515  ORF Transcript_100365/g.279515 Transcript_100365/m.279515 type:complete len:208 (-) Transcript_100365:3845-4468(-)